MEHGGANPWRSTARSLGDVGAVLAVARQTGHLARDSDEKTPNVGDKYLSLKLIKLWQKIAEVRGEVSRVELEVERVEQEHNTRDLTDASQLNEKVENLKAMCAYLQSVLASKGALMSQLQQPHKGDGIKLDASCHQKFVSMFQTFTTIVNGAGRLTEHLEWVGDQHKSALSFEDLEKDVSSFLASLHATYQSLSRLRTTFTELETP